MINCQHGEHEGKPCACADCRHDDGVCVAHESGSGCGCGRCDGPVDKHCDLTDTD